VTFHFGEMGGEMWSKKKIYSGTLIWAEFTSEYLFSCFFAWKNLEFRQIWNKVTKVYNFLRDI